MITIRQETPADHAEIYSLIQTAFASAEHRDGNEQDLVDALRKSEAFIPELSLVAQLDRRIAGHILFTKARIGKTTQLSLAPLSVLPPFQRQGIGTALIQEGHRIAKELGYAYSIVLGSETYYPRLGYAPASLYGIRPPFEVPDANFMAFPLRIPAPQISGVLEYAPEFEI